MRIGPRDGWSVTAEVATWDVWVLRVVHPAGSFIVCLADDEVDAWLQAYDSGALDNELDGYAARPPRHTLRRLPPGVRRTLANRPSSIGIEHEFEVRRGDRVVPFGTLIDRRGVEGVRADPADPNARRSPLGVVTVDGVEAEIATPPIPIRPGCPADAVAAAERATGKLRHVLHDDERLVGVSTHVSVSWTIRRAAARSREWAATFAPVVMLLMDRPTSPGLLVRPRPGRLELCGEHVDGDRLRATISVAVASVSVLIDKPRACKRLAVRQRLEPAVARFGWYVDRTATGHDLYQLGRRCSLERRDGTLVTAGQQLLDVARLLTPVIIQTCGRAHADLVREFAEGERAVGCELTVPELTAGAVP